MVLYWYAQRRKSVQTTTEIIHSGHYFNSLFGGIGRTTLSEMCYDHGCTGRTACHVHGTVHGTHAPAHWLSQHKKWYMGAYQYMYSSFLYKFIVNTNPPALPLQFGMNVNVVYEGWGGGGWEGVSSEFYGTCTFTVHVSAIGRNGTFTAKHYIEKNAF